MLFTHIDNGSLFGFFFKVRKMLLSLMSANLADCVSLKPSWHMLCQCQSYFIGSFRIRDSIYCSLSSNQSDDTYMYPSID